MPVNRVMSLPMYPSKATSHTWVLLLGVIKEKTSFIIRNRTRTLVLKDTPYTAMGTGIKRCTSEMKRPKVITALNTTKPTNVFSVPVFTYVRLTKRDD